MHSHLKKALTASVSIAALVGVAGLVMEPPLDAAYDMQTTASTPPPSGAATSQGATAESARVEPLPSDGKGADESALRYYASLQQNARVEAEIKRLKTLYPDWTPPENLYNTPSAGGVDEQPLWDLFSLGKLDELRADIDRRMKEEPGWRPSADLMDKIRRKDVRIRVTELFKAGRMKDIVAFIQGNQEAVGEDQDVDILWTIAEAYARAKQTTDALATYKQILKNSREPDQRLATIQKAMAVLRMSDVEDLIAMARRDSSGRSEFDSIALDITRGRISAFLHDERSEPIADGELKAFQDFARNAPDANQSGLVAWYFYKTKVFSPSLEWFKIAIGKGGDAMIAHGLAHALRELGMYRETEEVAYVWREPLVNNSILFIDILERDLTKEIPPYIEPERLLRYAQVTMDNASGEGAQGLAWYAYNSCQYSVALEWFERAVAWLPKEATVYGYALTLQKLKKTKEFWDVLNRYDGLFPKVIEIVYPDDTYKPPSPCDMLDARSTASARNRPAPNGFTPPAPYGHPYAQMQPQPGGYGAAPATLSPQAGVMPSTRGPIPPAAPQPIYANPYAQAPAYGQAGYYQNSSSLYAREPNIDRKNFPVSTDTQNPLRFHPTGRFLGQPGSGARTLLGPSPFVNEPPIGMRSLVARRVPDVARMPYERWGYALLPGYNGIAAASGPHSASNAPAGTLWVTLQGKDAASTRQDTMDPLRHDPAALAYRMSTIPRVPPPGASTAGPWRNLPLFRPRESAEADAQSPAAALAGSAPPAPPAGPANRFQEQSSAMAPRGAAPMALPAQSPPVAPQPLPPAQAHQPTPQPRVESHATDALGRKAADLYNRQMYAEAIDALDQRMRSMPETTDLRLIRAWSLMNLNRNEEARRVFSTLSNVRRAVALETEPAKTGNR